MLPEQFDGQLDVQASTPVSTGEGAWNMIKPLIDFLIDIPTFHVRNQKTTSQKVGATILSLWCDGLYRMRKARANTEASLHNHVIEEETTTNSPPIQHGSIKNWFSNFGKSSNASPQDKDGGNGGNKAIRRLRASSDMSKMTRRAQKDNPRPTTLYYDNLPREDASKVL